MNHSLLASSTGYSKDNKWKKLYDRIPEHQESISHKKLYVAWRNFRKVIGCSATISVQLNRSIENETAIWKALLHRFLQVVLFLGERGLAFRGDSQRNGDPNNGNFLGILELIGQYDKILGDHLSKVYKRSRNSLIGACKFITSRPKFKTNSLLAVLLM